MKLNKYSIMSMDVGSFRVRFVGRWTLYKKEVNNLFMRLELNINDLPNDYYNKENNRQLDNILDKIGVHIWQTIILKLIKQKWTM